MMISWPDKTGDAGVRNDGAFRQGKVCPLAGMAEQEGLERLRVSWRRARKADDEDETDVETLFGLGSIGSERRLPGGS